jgi:hypothetical protein
MSNETTKEQKEIEEIIGQLQDLQIRQGSLLTRLEQLNEISGGNESGTNRQGNAARPTRTRDRARELQIGDPVIIRNPTVFQLASKGKIIKINLATDRITVQTRSGSKIVRSKKNLILDPTA